MPRWPKKVQPVPGEPEQVPFPKPDNHQLSAKEPTALEKAMEMLILSQANTQNVLGRISETMDKVAQGIDKINDNAQKSIDHQIDLDQVNKSKPFKIQMLYQVDQKTIDLGDGIFEYENTGRSFKTKDEAVTFGNKNFGQQRFRIVEVEMPISQV